MKKILLSTIALSLFALGGCDLDRTYLNGPDASTFPASKSEVEAGVFSIYSALANFNVSSTPFVGLEDNTTDIGVSRINTAYYNDQFKSKVAINNVVVTRFYKNFFVTIGRCNLLLDNLDSQRGKMTEQEYNMYKSELIVMRAYVQDIMCQFWGDIPYIDHTLGVNDTYERTPRAEVTAKILECLDDDMLDFLPVRHSKKDYGSARIGRVCAYGIKARICLNWGMYEEAAKYADKALTLAEEAGYTLEHYDTSFCGENHEAGEPSAANLFGISGHQSSDEWIWTLQYDRAISGNTHNSMYYNSPRTLGGCSYFGPTQAFMDTFQCTDGKSIVESPMYNPAEPWKNRDPRLDLFCVRSGSRVLGVEFEIGKSIKKVMNYNTGKEITNSSATGSKSEYGANGTKGPGGYLWRKYLDITEYANNNYSFGTKSICTLSFPLMRLSELYLIRAEANIELGRNLDIAKSDIEAVRSKADMPALTVSDRAGLRSALRYERMVELCNEGFRWFDIRRWKAKGDATKPLASEILNGPIYAPHLDGTLSNAKPTIDENWCVSYNGDTWDGEPMNLRTYATAEYISPKNDLWPIPEDEMTAAHLRQNDGYN